MRYTTVKFNEEFGKYNISVEKVCNKYVATVPLSNGKYHRSYKTLTEAVDAVKWFIDNDRVFYGQFSNLADAPLTWQCCELTCSVPEPVIAAERTTLSHDTSIWNRGDNFLDGDCCTIACEYITPEREAELTKMLQDGGLLPAGVFTIDAVSALDEPDYSVDLDEETDYPGSPVNLTSTFEDKYDLSRKLQAVEPIFTIPGSRYFQLLDYENCTNVGSGYFPACELPQTETVNQLTEPSHVARAAANLVVVVLSVVHVMVAEVLTLTTKNGYAVADWLGREISSAWGMVLTEAGELAYHALYAVPSYFVCFAYGFLRGLKST